MTFISCKQSAVRQLNDRASAADNNVTQRNERKLPPCPDSCRGVTSRAPSKIRRTSIYNDNTFESR